MPRLNRSTHTNQEALVSRIVATGATRTEIARTAGVDVSIVSKWTSEGEDGREVQLSCLLRLADCYGWDVVLGPLASPAGWNVTRRDAEPIPVVVGTVALVEGAAAMLGEAHAAYADGHVTAPERASLLRRLYGVGKTIAGLISALEGGR